MTIPPDRRGLLRGRVPRLSISVPHCLKPLVALLLEYLFEPPRAVLNDRVPPCRVAAQAWRRVIEMGSLAPPDFRADEIARKAPGGLGVVKEWGS